MKQGVCMQRYRDLLGNMEERERERIVLHSSQILKKFPVFEDREIGIHKAYRNHLQENDSDEDCDSTEEMVEEGVKKSMRILEERDKQEQDIDSRPTVKRRKQ